MAAADQAVSFGELNIDTKGAIAGLTEWRGEVREALQKIYPALGREVIRRGKPKAPIGPGPPITKHSAGQLQRDIRQTAAKSAATIKMGGTSKVPYAGPAHWGWDGKSGPWFMYRVGYPQAKGRKRGPVADWIWDRIVGEVNETIKRLNAHLGRDIQLVGTAFKT